MTKSRGLRVRKGTRPLWVAENQGRHLCQCGCGTAVQLRPEHFPDIPRFVHGHNTAVTHRKPKPEPRPCACGCAELASPGKRFRPGHSGRGQKRSAATRAKLSAGKLGELNPMYGRPAHNRKPPPPQRPCLCGCGQLARSGRRYLSGHNNLGSRLSNYTGRFVDHGYVRIQQPGHPFADRDGYALEHRVIVEIHLRQTEPDSPHLMQLGEQLYLRPEIQVHFVDGVTTNNELSNLRPMTVAEHTRLHHAQGDILR